jgi:NADH-quinone oxidoreductase subunit E
MSVRRLAEEQPTSFEFTPENKAWAEKELAKYPPGRQASAVLALLWRAQKQSGYWLPRPAIETVAAMLEMPNIRVFEVATFYTMFNLAPVGRHYVQLCGTTPCMLCGAEDLKAVCRKRIGEQGHVTPDGLFSWTEVECLGACCNAPMVQINEDYYEDLTPENFATLLDDLAAGRSVKTGSQIGRVSSEPVGGLTALTTLYGADGRRAPLAPAPANDQSPAPLDEAAAHAHAEEAHINAPLATLPTDATPKQRADAFSNRPPATEAPSAPTLANDQPPAHLDEATAHAHAEAEEAHINEALAKLPAEATPEEKANAVGARPLALEAPRGAAEDLQRIKGVGPVNEKHLHGLGVFHFDQIAAWTRAEIRWVGTYLAFPGRIDREQWVAQAANLARGGSGPKDEQTHTRLPTGKIGD